MRQAWLIIAHNEFEVLQRLVSMLDAPESDFYIHFDKKVAVLPDIHVKKGHITILDPRIDVCWGTVSQIKTELFLLDTAHKKGPYGHYHILSGTHLPLKSFEELMHFYEDHVEEEIMRFWEPDEGDADFKLRRYHYPMRYFKSSGHPMRKAIDTFIWKVFLKTQKILKIRHLINCEFHKTDNWLSLSENACSYLLQQQESILRKYRWSFCGDEYFVATELQSSSKGFRLFDCQNLLYVEFLGDTPLTFSTSNYQEIKKKGFIWGRKFTTFHAR